MLNMSPTVACTLLSGVTASQVRVVFPQDSVHKFSPGRDQLVE